MKELTMTVVCSSCEHQYGRWRPQCPACGTVNDVAQRDARKDADERRKSDTARVRERKRELKAHGKRSKTECILCRKGGGKLTCPHCNEHIHKGCLSLHSDDCAAFQVSLKECYKKHGLETN